jgi:hypothetical protein
LAPAFVSITFEGFQIAVGDPLLVCFRQRISNLRRVANSLLWWQRPFPQPLLQRFAIEQLHYEEIHAVLMADIVKRTDVGMRKFGDGLRFAL